MKFKICITIVKSSVRKSNFDKIGLLNAKDFEKLKDQIYWLYTIEW